METWMKDAQIYKANALIEASYRLSLYEQRIILACISQVRRDEDLTDQQLYIISAKQISDISGISVKRAYQHIKVASEKLFDRRVTLYEAPNGDGHAKVKLTRWVQEVVYQESLGSVAIRFSQPMIPYLSQFTEQFTRYALADVAKMTSVHAIRLYEFLAQWRSTGERIISIDWFREVLQLEGRYSSIKDLKRRVLIPSVEQINLHSPLWLKWEQKKTGRTITHINFTFGEKEETKDININKNAKKTNKEIRAIYGIPMSVIENKAMPGESYEDAALRILEKSR